jgi:hypothetical protein
MQPPGLWASMVSTLQGLLLGIKWKCVKKTGLNRRDECNYDLRDCLHVLYERKRQAKGYTDLE